jgi:WD40 repeat protein/serine/threonine protein kinase
MWHPADDELDAFAKGLVGGADLDHVSTHLNACPTCRGRVDGLSREDVLITLFRAANGPGGRFQEGKGERLQAAQALRRELTRENFLVDAAQGPPVVAGYRVIRRIGEGGMGTVYEAEQADPPRTVALKILRPELDSADHRKRFSQEARILSGLHHAGIAEVYESGVTEGGRLFFAMEFIHGLPLDEYVRRTALDTPSCLGLVARICEAVQHAHDRQVIHRDLKPANILVNASGEPRVLDFGVAHATGFMDTTAHTRTGQLIGTLRYMSPEQVAGEQGAIDGRSDVYALGVILYELLSGRMPYRIDDLPFPELVRAIREVEPPRLGSVNRQFRGEIETIVGKALEKDRSRRYSSAGELGDDLRRHVANVPIRARPNSSFDRARRFVSRNKALVAGAAVVFATLVSATVISLFSAHDAHKNARLARAQAYQARLAAAIAALTEHDISGAARHLEKAPEELRGWEWRHIHSRLDDRIATITAEPGEVLFLIKRGDRFNLGRHLDASLSLTDRAGHSRKTIPLLSPTSSINLIQQTYAGLRIVESDAGRSLYMRNENGEVLLQLKMTSFTARLSPDGSLLAAYLAREGQAGNLIIHDTASGKRLAQWTCHGIPITAICFSPDGKWIATASEDRTCRVWDIATRTRVAECRGHGGKLLGVAFRSDGARLVTTSADGTVRQWEPATGREVEPPFEHHTAEVLAASYSPDGQWVASGGADHTIRIWRASGGLQRAVLHGHAGAVNDLAFAADGQSLASISQDRLYGFLGDNTIGVWDLSTVDLPVLRGHTDYVYPVSYSPDGRWIASGSWDGAISLRDAATGEEHAKLPQPGAVRSLAFSPDSAWLAVGGDFEKNELLLWSTTTGQILRHIPVPFASVQHLAMSPDGRRFAVGPSGRVEYSQLVDIASGTAVGAVEGLALAFSPDGKWLAGRDQEGKSVVLRDAANLRIVATWEGHTDLINAITFRRDGGRILTASSDHTVRVWDPTTGKCSRIYEGHTDKVYAAVFHPDGSRVASAGRDRDIWIWGPEGDQEGVRLPGHASYVWSLAFSPDGKSIVSGSGDHTVRLWDTEPLRERYELRRADAALRPDAERLVDDLFRQEKSADEVVALIQAHPSLSELQRNAALRAVLRKSGKREK